MFTEQQSGNEFTGCTTRQFQQWEIGRKVGGKFGLGTQAFLCVHFK